jgi:hypothetical protein
MDKNERLKKIAKELREIAMQGHGNPTAVTITVDTLCDYADELERMAGGGRDQPRDTE